MLHSSAPSSLLCLSLRNPCHSFCKGLILRSTRRAHVSTSVASKRLHIANSSSKKAGLRQGVTDPRQSYNPNIRALLEANRPTLLYEARSHTSRTAARIFIGISCFVMAGHCATIFLDPPQQFSPLLRRFMIVISIAIGGFGLIAVSRNILSIRSITAIPRRASAPDTCMLRIETTRWPPWRESTIYARPQEVSLSEPIRAITAPNDPTSTQLGAARIARQIPLAILHNQFKNLWHAFREIVFAESIQLTIEGHTSTFRVDERPIFALGGGSRLNNIVKHTYA